MLVNLLWVSAAVLVLGWVLWPWLVLALPLLLSCCSRYASRMNVGIRLRVLTAQLGLGYSPQREQVR